MTHHVAPILCIVWIAGAPKVKPKYAEAFTKNAELVYHTKAHLMVYDRSQKAVASRKVYVAINIQRRIVETRRPYV